jgi:hypothetical protein
MDIYPWGGPFRRELDRGARALKRRFERVTRGIEKRVRWRRRRRRLAILAVAVVIGFALPFAVKPAIPLITSQFSPAGAYHAEGIQICMGGERAARRATCLVDGATSIAYQLGLVLSVNKRTMGAAATCLCLQVR